MPDRGDRGDLGALLASLEAGMDVIRQPSHAAREVLAVTQDPECSAGELVRLISRNPTLAQALLRSANSAYYAAGTGRCATIGEAVRRIGTMGVYNVVLGNMLDGLLWRPGVA